MKFFSKENKKATGGYNEYSEIEKQSISKVTYT